VRTLASYLIQERGHQRLTIDPAADNAAAIRAYEKVGSGAVGVMREYLRSPDGTWRDGLLLDLLAPELIEHDAPDRVRTPLSRGRKMLSCQHPLLESVLVGSGLSSSRT
jgi:hypothetical protein